MLRITMSVSGEGATKYFDAALATSKYYGSERGQWGGKGAELLGLRGDVHRKDFIALASNKRPGTDETLTVRMKATRKQKEVGLRRESKHLETGEDGDVSNHRAGYDFYRHGFRGRLCAGKRQAGAKSRQAKSGVTLDPEDIGMPFL